MSLADDDIEFLPWFQTSTLSLVHDDDLCNDTASQDKFQSEQTNMTRVWQMTITITSMTW